MLDFDNDFKIPNNKHYTEEEYFLYLEHVLDAYKNDNRFRALIDGAVKLKSTFTIDKFWVYSTMLSVRNYKETPLFYITYPPYNSYSHRLKIYLAKTLDYRYAKCEHNKIEIEYTKNGSLANYGFPVTYIRNEIDVNWIIGIFENIVCELCDIRQ